MANKKKTATTITHTQDIDLGIWLSRTEAISMWRKLLASPLMRDAIGVLYSQMPVALSSDDAKVTDTQSSIQLGRIQGYVHAMEVIRVMGQFQKTPPDQIESDFGYESFLKKEGLIEN